MSSLPYWYAAVGAVLLIAEMVLVCREQDPYRPAVVLEHPRLWVLFRWILGIATLNIIYPLGGDYLAIGFPFMAGVPKKQVHGYTDYVSPLTFFIFAANVVFFQLLPQLSFAAYRHWLRRNKD